MESHATHVGEGVTIRLSTYFRGAFGVTGNLHADPMGASAQLHVGPAMHFEVSSTGGAKRFGVTVEHVKALNRMTGNTLQARQSLRIDGEPALAKASAEFVAVRAAPVAKEKPAAPQRIYTVRPGDSLFAIAVKFGVELDDLLRWNKLSGRTIIQPGLKIRLASL